MSIYAELPSGERVQRVDTLNWTGEQLIGLRIHHPHMQVGDEPAWDVEQVIALERKICRAGSITEEEEEADRMVGLPEHDVGVITEVFTDRDFHDRTRVRFVDPITGYSLQYDITNLWATDADIRVRMIGLLQEARQEWTGCNWSHEAGTFDGIKNFDMCPGDHADEGCRYCKDVKEAADSAAGLVADAIEECEGDADLNRVLDLLLQAARIEREYGNAPAYGPVVHVIEQLTREEP